MPAVLEAEILQAPPNEPVMFLQPDTVGVLSTEPTAKLCRCGERHVKLPRAARGIAKGHAWAVVPSRLGHRDFKTVIRAKEADLADAYVKHAEAGNGSLLVDSRKVFVPIDSDKSGTVADAQPVLAFLAQHLTLIMQQPPTLQPVISVAAQPAMSATPPTLSLSAGTGGERYPPTPPAGIQIPS